MSNNKHRIVITAIPADTAIYASSMGGWFPQYILVDAKTGKSKPPLTLLDRPIGRMVVSGEKDRYRNKDCYHTYTDFSGMIGFNQLADVTFSYGQTTIGKTRYYVRSGYLLQRFAEYIPSKGTARAKAGYSVIESSGPTGYKVRNYDKDGRYTHAEIGKLINFVPPKSLDGGYCIYEYTQSFVYTAAQKKLGYKDVVNHYTTTDSRMIYISYTKNVDYPSAIDLMSYFSRISDYKIKGHLAPSSITDDIFDSFAIPDVNNIENLKDLKDIKRSIPPIVSLLKTKSFKSLSELYLWYKYSYSTTLLDIKSYYEFFQKIADEQLIRNNCKVIRLSYQAATDSSLEESHTTHYEIKCSTYNAGVFEALGLNLNLSNTWDLLPFSFVVDWFLNIGDILARIDHSDILSNVKVLTVITSSKSTWNFVPLSAHGCYATCISTMYRRDISKTLPTGSISFSVKNPLYYITNGAALVIANKRH